MRALVLVDIQNDFLPTGSLPVPEGDRIVPVANAVAKRFDLVVATQDWHPPSHASFAANHPGRKPGELIELDGLSQILWPVHCVQGTPGAQFAPDLDPSSCARIFHKVTDARIDSYSGFFDNGHRQATGLGDYLMGRGIRSVYLLGLATDYCVKFTALDARRLGFDTHLLLDGCRGVDRQAGDGARAIDEMRAAGVHITNSKDL
jgi:nicotinamidase/pyrazinamidase